SPETMLSPGTPTTVANAIVDHVGDSEAMARAIIKEVMEFSYQSGLERWHPAAAFDVLDLSREKWSSVERDLKAFNDTLGAAPAAETRLVRQDAQRIEGMVRFPDSNGMPWRADLPAIALYSALARDSRLDDGLRAKAREAAAAVAATVIAHRESSDAVPFGDADYRDAVGPTVHFPTNRAEIDPWAPRVSETDNAFYKRVDGVQIAHTITSAAA
ncbi:MAG: hypothetical protein JO233_07220, partial [Candidatus Eremiobacteraeota bacterium]|nr:hypothetical protein [Candidatus Eremiobacteraeota bacterium]